MAKKLFFRPRARLLLLLGEQLISNEVIALVELVKNAYDADATSVMVRLQDFTEQGTGRIIVEDDGSGMTPEIITGVWLEPATDFKTNMKKEGVRTPKFGRLPLGEKGIGRFAAHKLGEKITLITRSKNDKLETLVEINWNDFKKNKYLDQVPITLKSRKPTVFTGTRHGTRLEIESPGKHWTSKMVINLAEKLLHLTSPFAKKRDFQVNLVADDFIDALKDTPTIDQVVEAAFYSFSGKINSLGLLQYKYQFKHPLSSKLKRTKERQEQEIKDPKYFGSRLPKVGAFTVNFYVVDRDPQLLKELRSIDEEVGSKIDIFRKQTGVRLYRDDFRVWPYGEPGDDWLKLDNRRVQNPTQKVGNDQIIGIIEISDEKNPGLRDKTDREGLVWTEDFEDFIALVTGALTAFESERRQDKDVADESLLKIKSGKGSITGDPVEMEITTLEEEISKRGDTETYKNNLANLRATYRKTLETTLDPLLMAAGIGLSYTLPIHELQRNFGDLKLALADENLTSTSSRSIFSTLKEIEGIIKGAESIMKSGKTLPFKIASPVDDAIIIIERRLSTNKIIIERYIDKDLEATGKRNLLITAVLNLLDNSEYWLRLREHDRKVRITVEPKGKWARIVVADNGSGIQDDPELIIRPFFTRKTEGSGLGLHIVSRIIRSFDGRLNFLKYKVKDKATLEGANVEILLPLT